MEILASAKARKRNKRHPGWDVGRKIHFILKQHNVYEEKSDEIYKNYTRINMCLTMWQDTRSIYKIYLCFCI